MRLIDADLLELHEIYDGQGFTNVVYKDDVDDAPTVDVIPMSVVDDIKAEIEEVGKNALGYPNWEYAKGLEMALKIIDKHIEDESK